MILIIKLIKESAIFAFTSILVNKLRTILTLLGITIGIFSIITVFSIVDAMENQVRTSVESLGDNVIYIQKWPWAMGGEYQWWRYTGRPVPQLHELEHIQRRSVAAEYAAFTAFTTRTVEYMGNSVSNVSVQGVSADYDKVQFFEIEDGRYFSTFESSTGRNVAILGNEVAGQLFQNTDPIGKSVKIFGRRVKVIGVIKKQGEGAVFNSHDRVVILPVNFIANIIDVNHDRYSPMIIVKGHENVSAGELSDELTGIMRSIRRLKPQAEDNFALNEPSIIAQGLESLFKIITMAGWIIGGFAILVGGFGIANIMFVSVRERINIIGIQKALGAKKYFILLQFLFEAVMLSLIGGIVGLIFVFGITALLSALAGMNMLLDIKNIMLGINVSVIIGLIAGFLPAYSASKLDPVVAIRTNR